MDIKYETINGVEYLTTTYNNEVIKIKVISNDGARTTKADAELGFQDMINLINEELSRLDSEDLQKEKNRNEQEHLTLVDLKKPIEEVGEI